METLETVDLVTECEKVGYPVGITAKYTLDNEELTHEAVVRDGNEAVQLEDQLQFAVDTFNARIHTMLFHC